MLALQAGLEEYFDGGLEVQDRVLQVPRLGWIAVGEVVGDAKEVVDAVLDRREVDVWLAAEGFTAVPGSVGVVVVEPKSWTVTMFGWARPPTTAASRANRATCRLLPASPVSTLTATCGRSWGRVLPRPVRTARTDRLDQPVAPVQYGPFLHGSPFSALTATHGVPGVYPSRYAEGTCQGRRLSAAAAVAGEVMGEDVPPRLVGSGGEHSASGLAWHTGQEMFISR
ncbi:hypothetical protein ABZ656_45490 [Streptomyces sp. NPDC007095]|uniref:hypothetical protein n=1 Tax=Streptomyces sp. NPDC007095 TaxID=3154482 RepID=UPI0033CF46FC